MLVLTGRDGEELNIKVDPSLLNGPTDIKIVIFGSQHGQTKIGIDAPKCINIVRDEIDES